MSEDNVDMSLGRRLRRRRRMLELTQQELADGIGITFQQVHKYECASNRMSAAMLWRLARFLGVEVGYFYEDLELSRHAASEARAFQIPAE